MSNRIEHLLGKHLFVLLLSPLWLFFCYRFCATSFDLVLHLYPLDYTEGIEFIAATRVFHGEPLYTPLDQVPHVYYAYPIGHPYLSALFFWLFDHSIRPLRLLSVLCELSIALIVYKSLVLRGTGRVAAVTFGTALLYLYAANRMHAIARVDHQTVMFSIAGLFFVQRYLCRGDKWSLWLYSSCFLCGLLSKPTAIAMLGACGLYALLLCFRQRRIGLPLLMHSALPIVGYLAILIVVNHHYDGLFLQYVHLFHAQTTFGEFSHDNPIIVFLKQYWQLVALGVGVVAVVRGSPLIRLVTVISVSWFAVSSLKRGSAMNYSLEPIAVLTIAAAELPLAAAAGRLRRLGTTLTAALRPNAAAFAIAFGLALLVQQDTFALDQMKPPLRAEREKINELMRATSGIILSEEALFAASNEKGLLMNDPFQFIERMEFGMFEMDQVWARCRTGEVSRIFAGGRLESIPGIQEVLNRHFHPTYRTQTRVIDGPWTVYEYGHGQRRTVDFGSLSAAPVAVDGWHEPEVLEGRTVIRGKGQSSRLEVSLDPDKVPYDFELRAGLFAAGLTNPARVKSLRVTINDYELQPIGLHTGWIVYRRRIPAGVLRRGVNQIRFTRLIDGNAKSTEQPPDRHGRLLGELHPKVVAPGVAFDLLALTPCKVERTARIDFGTQQARPALAEGWWFDDETIARRSAVWSVGRLARVEVPLAAEVVPYLLWLDVQPLTAPGKGPQEVRVYVNGMEVFEHQTNGVALKLAPRFGLHAFWVAAGILRTGLNRIDFRFAYATSPESFIRASTDKRRLSVAFDKLSLLPVDSGSVIDFGTSRGRPFLRGGWGRSEAIDWRSATWSAADSADLIVYLMPSSVDYRMQLHLKPFACVATARRRVEILVNHAEIVGHRALHLRSGWQQYTLPVPSSMLRRGRNVITFRFGKTVAPAECSSHSKDRRRLAAAFDHFSLMPIAGSDSVKPLSDVLH